MPAQTIVNTTKDGGCYCGAIRYAVSKPPLVKGQCHCRACQRYAGGAPQFFLLVPPEGFDWTKGSPAEYARPDLPNAVTRYFCPTCGTSLVTRRQDNPAVVVKVGTLDDPSRFTPHVAICHGEAPAFHTVPQGIAVFEDLPTG
ncbi:GFA family protein [uncultured Tateyamaria sp.]|uniref:GFA family protein n=1 Tax=uncultured Tateyamaria sp. TaxID=455651 RepID=UPI002625ACE8|nr:GFA family protein [uncultured Tateyamaria sp.]